MKTSIARFAKSKFFIPGIVITIFVIGWLFFIVAELGPSEERILPTDWGSKKDYVVKENSEGKFIINKSVGLTVKIPDGWSIDMPEDEEWEDVYWITLLGPGVKINPKDLTINGCGVSFWVKIQKQSLEILRNEIKWIYENPEEYIREYSREELIRISGLPAKKMTMRGKDPNVYERIGEVVGIEIPIGDKTIINIDTRFLPEYRERCSKEFDNFLETILINK